MKIYVYDSAIEQTTAQRVTFLARPGYTITQADAAQAEHHSAPATTTITGAGLVRIDTGLSLSEAHSNLTDGLTKAELVALGADLGLSLSETSLKAELLDAIQTHLEGLAP